MIVATPPPTVSDIAEHYDEIDPFYRRFWGEHLHHGLWMSGQEDREEAVRKLLDFAIDAVGVEPGDRVCDIGCGYGATARHLRSRYRCEVVGHTVSPSQYRWAVNRTPNDGRCRFVLGDWMRSTIPDASFEVVLALESSEHFSSKERLFEGVFRALVPGGRVAVCAWTAAEHPRRWEVSHLLQPICREGRLAGLATESEYRSWLHRSGFERIQCADLSRAVARTWTVVAGSVIRGLCTPGGWKYLLDSRHRNRDFLKSVFRIPLAYRTGALRYVLYTARKPRKRLLQPRADVHPPLPDRPAGGPETSATPARLDLHARRRIPELMDDPALEADRHVQALKDLGRLNRLSGSARTFWSHLRREPVSTEPLRVLDVACGGGDVVLDLARLSRASGRPLEADGCDLSPLAVRFASESARRRCLPSRFFVLDALREPFPSGYDFLITSLFLHHLDEPQAVSLLARMAASARRGILVSDLERTRRGLLLVWVVTRMFCRSPVVRYDGRASIRAAFQKEELRALADRAGLDAFTLTRSWPERIQLRWKRNGLA